MFSDLTTILFDQFQPSEEYRSTQKATTAKEQTIGNEIRGVVQLNTGEFDFTHDLPECRVVPVYSLKKQYFNPATTELVVESHVCLTHGTRSLTKTRKLSEFLLSPTN